jgi:hypothetical protein
VFERSHRGYIQADLRQPEGILSSAALRDVLDLTRPVALVLGAILHFVADEAKPRAIVATLLDALAAGSYLIAPHGTAEHVPAEIAARAVDLYRSAGITVQPRNPGEFAALAFGGLELVPPGVTLISE